jgi:hypothetical protein
VTHFIAHIVTKIRWRHFLSPVRTIELESSYYNPMHKREEVDAKIMGHLALVQRDNFSNFEINNLFLK